MKLLFYFSTILLCCCWDNAEAQPKKNAAFGYVQIVFNNLINNRSVVLYDSSYSNPFGETYMINKLKYYISNIAVYTDGKATKEKNSYHLINQNIERSCSFTISLTEHNYDSIQFLLGVDSTKNTSGAQTGALDPLNDMFWTWRTGYIMQKLEGTSPQSKVVNNKMEYHIGGFSGDNSVLNYITLHFPANKILQVKKGKTSIIIINVEIDKFWNADIDIKISDTPVCSSPGLLAKQIAGNFCKLFTLADVINNN